MPTGGTIVEAVQDLKASLDAQGKMLVEILAVLQKILESNTKVKS